MADPDTLVWEQELPVTHGGIVEHEETGLPESEAWQQNGVSIFSVLSPQAKIDLAINSEEQERFPLHEGVLGSDQYLTS